MSHAKTTQSIYAEAWLKTWSDKWKDAASKAPADKPREEFTRHSQFADIAVEALRLMRTIEFSTEPDKQRLMYLAGTNDRLRAELSAARKELEAAKARLIDLETLINIPQTAEFFEAVKLEAAHQIERWGVEHDEGKADGDWLFLLGHLGTKALNAGYLYEVADPSRDDKLNDAAHHREKRLHHIITCAAVCLNWHRARTGGNTTMRPGIANPDKS